MSSCNECSKISADSLGISNSGNYSSQLMPLANYLQLLTHFFNSFSKDVFNLISTSSAGALSNSSLSDSSSDQVFSLRVISVEESHKIIAISLTLILLYCNYETSCHTQHMILSKEIFIPKCGIVNHITHHNCAQIQVQSYPLTF